MTVFLLSRLASGAAIGYLLGLLLSHWAHGAAVSLAARAICRDLRAGTPLPTALHARTAGGVYFAGRPPDLEEQLMAGVVRDCARALMDRAADGGFQP